MENILQNEEHVKYGYIYKTTIHDEKSELNNCYYIGQHKWSKNEIDFNYFGSGIILNNYISFHGTDNLLCEIIEYAYSKEELDKLEEIYVNNDIINDPLCINLCIGGEGGNTSIKFSEERMNQFKDKMHIIGKQLWENEEYRDKVSVGRQKSASNQWQDPKIREKMIEGRRNANVNGEVGRKISETKKKQCADPEYREKMRIIAKEASKRKCYNNGILQAHIREEDVPEGWVEGKIYNRIPSDWKYYSNGIFQVRYKECPEGFRPGKTGIIKKQIEKSKKIKNKAIELNKKDKIINKEKNKSYIRTEEHKKRQSDMKKRSLETTNEREKISNSLKKFWENQSNEYKQEYSKKVKERANNKETKEKLSEAAKGRDYYNNGLLQIYVKEKDVPEGWIKGRIYDKLPDDWKYYHKGELTLKAPECPEGFKPGRYTNSSEYRKLKKKIKHADNISFR